MRSWIARIFNDVDNIGAHLFTVICCIRESGKLNSISLELQTESVCLSAANQTCKSNIFEQSRCFEILFELCSTATLFENVRSTALLPTIQIM